MTATIRDITSLVDLWAESGAISGVIYHNNNTKREEFKKVDVRYMPRELLGMQPIKLKHFLKYKPV